MENFKFILPRDLIGLTGMKKLPPVGACCEPTDIHCITSFNRASGSTQHERNRAMRRNSGLIASLAALALLTLAATFTPVRAETYTALVPITSASEVPPVTGVTA